MDWINGEEIQLFEERIAQYVGRDFAVVFNSGTSALHAMLLAYELTRGEIIVPSFTFIATANAALFTHMTPRFADIERETYGLDVDSVKKEINNRTKAIMPVHYGGCPCRDILDLADVAVEKNILFFEDAAESFGAKAGNMSVGCFGDAAMFSFCQNKIISCGEGGAIVTNDEQVAERLKIIRSHGKDKNGDYIMLGYNFRMPTMNAALGLSQMKRIDWIIKRRREIADAYNKEFEGRPKAKDGFLSVNQLYALEVDNRDMMMKSLDGKGVSTHAYFDAPVHLTPLYQGIYGYKNGAFPVTEEISKKVLNLPIYPDLTDEEITYIIEGVKESLKGGK
jgi:dTDP-4-amino-4,6-dideoxygalactose transaminase